MQSLNHDTQDPQPELIENFNQLFLKDELLQGISRIFSSSVKSIYLSLIGYGLQKPTEFQAKGITSILQFQDTIIHLQAGSGKSVLYAISILQMIDPSIHQLQALILAPTREVAKRDYELFLKLGESMNISIAWCINKPGSEETLQDVNTQIILGTVSGVRNLRKKGLVQLGKVRLLVLDETDDIFSRGLEADLRDLTKLLADETQIIVSTCTMPEEVKKYTEEFMNNPVVISKKQLDYVNANHFRVDVEKEEWKFETILDLFEAIDLQNHQCLVYCNSKIRAEKLVDELEKKSWRSTFLVAISLCKRLTFKDAEMIQHEKQSIVGEFSKGLIRLLIVTDALGNEFIPEVQLMINYDLPLNPEKYFSRAKKCRKSLPKKNLVMSFIINEDKEMIQNIEKYLNIKIEDLPLHVELFFVKTDE